MALCSLAVESLAKFNPSESKATVDVHWECVFIHPISDISIVIDVFIGVRCIFLAWASALLVLDGLGNARRLSSGTSNRYRLSRFFVFARPHN